MMVGEAWQQVGWHEKLRNNSVGTGMKGGGGIG